MVRLHGASARTLQVLKDRGAEILEVEYGEHLATFKKGGLEEMKKKIQAQQAESNSGKSKAKSKKDDDSRTTKELKALLKEKGVKFTQIMKRVDMLEIADHPEKEKEVIERVCNRWKAYIKELKERKAKKE